MIVKYTVCTINKSKVNHIINGKLSELFLAHVPPFIILIAEILKTHPYGVLEILNHIG